MPNNIQYWQVVGALGQTLGILHLHLSGTFYKPVFIYLLIDQAVNMIHSLMKEI